MLKQQSIDLILKKCVAIGIIALLSAPAIAAFSCQSGDSAQEIIQQRNQFNKAILDADITAIANILADNVILVTGTDSLLFNGKEAQLSIWQEDFDNPDERAIYHRLTTCVHVNLAKSMAMELGTWTGKVEETVLFNGTYTAKWRMNEASSKWELEAEIFMTTGASQ